MRRALLTLLCAAGLMAAASCQRSGAVKAAPSDEPKPVPIRIPPEARNLVNPLAGDAEAAETGHKTFTSLCSVCHGTGRGDGELAEGLDIDVPDLTDRKRQERRTDGELFYIITYGHGGMPGQLDRLSDEHKWSLVTYIRTLPTKK